jgi:WD40 repeat protein
MYQSWQQRLSDQWESLTRKYWLTHGTFYGSDLNFIWKLFVGAIGSFSPAQFASVFDVVPWDSSYGLNSARAIKLLDLETGATSEIARGLYPQLGPKGEFSYCDQHSTLIVAGLASPNTPALTTNLNSNCGTVGWSADGDLAVIGGSREVSLYVRGAGSSVLSPVPLGKALFGAGTPSWSSDSVHIAFSTNQGVAIADISTRSVELMPLYGVPQFAPGAPTLLAILDAGRDAPVLSVFSGKDKVAARTFHDTFLSSFAWSPDDAWLVTVADQEVQIWNWQTNESRVIATAPTGGFTTGVTWLP